MKLLDQVRHVIRKKHYSIRTEQAYTNWIKRFIRKPKTKELFLTSGYWTFTGNMGSPYKTVRVNNFSKLHIMSYGSI